MTMPLTTRARSALLALALPAALFAGAAHAETLSCPALDKAVQVAACPSDAELQYTFMGFCGDNARLYGRDVFTCATFENYKAVKNTALWESTNGSFSGYLSCNLDTATLRANDFNLSAGRYRPLSQAQVEHQDPRELLAELAAIEAEIAEEVEALRAVLGEVA